MSSGDAAAVQAAAPAAPRAEGFVAHIVGAAALAHLLNDMIQAVLPAIYPLLKAQFALSFTQVGWISMVYQLTASMLQPWIGL
ncbi:hypothetical protein DFR36_10678 [Melaminivora alkalimesophila]|uniref:MFS transporter n=1 Tax=Melaminivora alkalimesophila TaxID=1165852 RepID=A0A317R9E9_9BURK|nr:hypothetical protein DFR36_10678 [Melaminivora alkalimesophila]